LLALVFKGHERKGVAERGRGGAASVVRLTARSVSFSALLSRGSWFVGLWTGGARTLVARGVAGLPVVLSGARVVLTGFRVG
jgi:hypothetical protein